MSRRRRYLVCYDIRDDRRLRQVHQVAKSFGEPLQYSVFVCDLNRSERVSLDLAFREYVDMSADSIVFVDLGETAGRGAGAFEFLGYRPFPLPRGGPTIL